MLEKGHFQELHSIIERINVDEKKVNQRQNFVFSATLTMVHDLPDYLQRKKNRNSRSKISKMTPEQKLKKVIEMLKVKNPKIVDLTKQKGSFYSVRIYFTKRNFFFEKKCFSPKFGKKNIFFRQTKICFQF